MLSLRAGGLLVCSAPALPPFHQVWHSTCPILGTHLVKAFGFHSSRASLSAGSPKIYLMLPYRGSLHVFNELNQLREDVFELSSSTAIMFSIS
jgi:hypothetical protein